MPTTPQFDKQNYPSGWCLKVLPLDILFSSSVLQLRSGNTGAGSRAGGPSDLQRRAASTGRMLATLSNSKGGSSRLVPMFGCHPGSKRTPPPHTKPAAPIPKRTRKLLQMSIKSCHSGRQHASIAGKKPGLHRQEGGLQSSR